MKKIITIIYIILLYTQAYSQNELKVVLQDKSYTQGFDSITAQLNKTKITTGTLYNRVIPWANLTMFTDTTKVSTEVFYQAWFEIYNATYENHGMKTSEKIQLKTAYLQHHDTLSIGVINYKFNTFSYNAMADSSLKIEDGVFKDGTNNNAYETKISSFATLLHSEIIAGKNYFVQLNPEFILQNNPNTIKKVTINITKTRGGHDFLLNSGKVLAFNEVGEYQLTIKAELIDGTLTTVFQEITVTDGLNKVGVPSQLCPSEPTTTLVADIPYNGYDGNLQGQAQIAVYPHTFPNTSVCEHIIKKPIIVLDGFDYQDKRFPDKLYTEYLSYFDGATGIQVGDSLRLKGYDVIIFNPIIYANGGAMVDGGVDYIQRNAFTLVKLIQQLNAQLATNNPGEKIVIIGPSMGGQISRYALRYMEQNGLNHNCREWISFDSPHLGANIPITAQHFVKFFGLQVGQSSAQTTLHSNLLSPASQQMLINQTQYLGSVNDNYYNNSNPERQSWINTLNSIGFPTQTRNVALINGRSTGDYFHSPSSSMYNFLLLSPAFPIVSGYANGNFLPTYQNSSDIFKGKVQFCIPFMFWNICFDIIGNHTSYTNNDIKSCIDACPGGLYDVQEELADEGNSISNWVASWFVGLTHDISFIPAVSSLAFNSSNFDWKTRFDDRNLVCTNEIPFHNYFAPTANESHVSVSKQSTQWLLQEIQKGNINCPDICSYKFNNTLTNICTGINTTISLDNPIPNQAGFTTTWSTSANIQIISSTNNSVVVKGLTYSTTGFIKAVISNPCGADRIIVKEGIIVGIQSPPTPSITLSSTPNCYKWDVTVQFPSPPAGTTYDWGVGVYPNCNVPSCSSTGSNAGTFTKLMTSGQKIQWSSSATNVCGTEYNDGQILELDVTYGTPCTAQLIYIGVPLKTNYSIGNIITPNDDIIIFPNPSSSFWTISIMKNEIEDLTYTLSDITGKTLLQKSYANINMNDIIVDNSNLPIGTYFLNIETSTRSYNFKVLKN